MSKISKNSAAIRFMAEFTRTYREAGEDIYAREIRCMEVQTEYILMPPEEGDLIVGIRIEAPIGFTPQGTDDRMGYYCDEKELSGMLHDETLTEDEKNTVRELLTFWKGRTTQEKTYALYNEALKRDLEHGDFSTHPGFGFPLYRMSGSQMDPDRLLKLGIDGMKQLCHKKHDRNPAFYQGIEETLNMLSGICTRYAAWCHEQMTACANEERKRELAQMVENLDLIAHQSPKTMWQAMQLAHLFYLMAGSINFGRMDDYIGPFYVRDLANGTVTQDFALKLVMNQWMLYNRRRITFDGRVVLGGKGRRHPKEADRFAMLAMEATSRLKEPLPQLTLRCYKDMDGAVYKKALKTIGEGTTYPMLYNDEVNIPAVMNAFCVDEETAQQYIPFGCGEYVLYNRSFGTPSGAINLLHGLNHAVYGDKAETLEQAQDFETFYKAYMQQVLHIVELLALQEKLEYDANAADAPYYFFDLLFDDCIERGKPIFDGGLRHLGGTLESYGNTNTADSLTAIKKLVFDEKRVTVAELQEALRCDFDGYEDLRAELLAAPKYGNDHAEADAMAVRLHEDMCDFVRNSAKKVGLDSYLMVVINNSMNTTFGLNTGASADGRYANTYMANANNPTGGMDQSGITAMLNSLLKIRPERHAGTVQNMRFGKEMFGRLLDKTKDLLKVYFENGGTQAMITVLGRGDLEAALEHPEQYANLMVRVGGFSARFVELDRNVQMELISRTLY